MGGTISTVAQIGDTNTGARNRAEYILTPESEKQKMKASAAKISNLAVDLEAAEGEAADIIKKEILKEENNIINIKKRNSLALRLLDKNQLQLYATNIDKINKNKNIKGPESAIELAKIEISNLTKENNEILELAESKKLKKSIEFAETVSAKIGKNIRALTNEETISEFGKDAEGADGFVVGNEIIINKDIAKETGAVTVGSHEILHPILESALKGKDQQKIIDEFKNIIGAKQLAIVEERLQGNYKADYIAKNQDEYITVFSDAILKGEIKYNDNIFTKLGDLIRSILRKFGFSKIEFNTGRDVYNFLKEYNKSVAAGDVSQEIIDITKDDVSQKIVDIAKDIENEVKKFSRSKEASDRVQEIYEAQGAANAMDIIDEFKPITNKIVNKYRDVPGFEFELLRDEIETGKRGILDMIMDYTPEKAKGAPLAAYINSLLPKRAIEAANRILDTEFKADVTEAKGVTDTATAEETIEATEQADVADEVKSLRKEIGLPEELISTIKNAVIKTFGTKLPNPQDPKFRLELQRRFRTELKKPIAKFIGKQEAYESFLRDNFQSIYNKLPQSLINRRFKDFAEPVLDENGKQLRERTAEGKKVFTKKKITKAEFIKYFLGSDVGRSTQGTRKTAIVEAVAEEIAFDATMEVLNDPDVIQKYQDIAGITGEVLPENFKALIAKQVDRAEDFKFSKSIANNAKAEYDLESQELARILNETSLDKLSDKYSLISDAIIYEADENNIKFSLTTKADGKWEQEPLNPLDESSKIYKFEVGEINYEIKTFKEEFASDDSVFEQTEEIALREAIDNDPKSWVMSFADADTGSTDVTGVAAEGLTNQFKVFGTVANAAIDLIKNEKLNSITFSAKEKSRKRLYKSLNEKFAKELGWDTYSYEIRTPDGKEAMFIAYNPKAFPSTNKIKFSLSSKEKAAAGKIINKLQNDILKNIESESVNFTDDLNVFILNKFNEEVEKDLNLNEILENVINATNSFITDKTGKNLISKAVLDTDGKLTRNYFLKIKQATGIALKKEIAELGYESSKKLLEDRIKNASENDRPTIIKNWFINESKAITTFSGLPNITKIQDIYNKVLASLLRKYNIKGFKMGKNPKGAGQKLFLNNIPINRYKSTTDIKRNFAEYIFQINEESNYAKQYILGILDYYKNNNLINEGKAHIKLLANDQIGALRKLAKAGMYVENLLTKETTLEHQTPVLEITLDSNNFLDGKISREQLEKEFDNAQINLVTKNVDQALTAANLKSSGKNRMQNNLVKEAVKNDIKNGKKYKNIESVYKNQKFSRSLDKEFNLLLQATTKVDWTKEFTPVKAKLLGRGKGKKNLYTLFSR